MSTHDFEAAIIARMTARKSDPTDPGTRHVVRDIQMGQRTSPAEYREIEACGRHVPTAEERAGYERFVRETMEQRR